MFYMPALTRLFRVSTAAQQLPNYAADCQQNQRAKYVDSLPDGSFLTYFYGIQRA
jgi:hypothetical protein